MVDVNIIIERYASMTDVELISFAKEEGHELTAVAFHILKDEFNERKLDQTIIEDIENGKISKQAELIKNIDADTSRTFTATDWSYAFEQKEYKKTDEEIVYGLMETGMDEPHALMITTGLELKARQLLKKVDSERLTGGFIFMGGISINFLPFPHHSNRLSYIIAWCAILFGAGRFLKASYNHHRFRKIIQNITVEKNS